MLERADFDRVTAWLAPVRRPLLFSHQRPDGDALGALAAMGHALRTSGARPAVCRFEPFPPRYRFLEPMAEWHDWATDGASLAREADAVVIVDTCALGQLAPIADYLKSAPRTLVIDHHATRDAIGERPGDLRLIDDSAGAVCLLIAEWLAAAGRAVDRPCATGLLTGLATDCGWFRFSNTDARMLAAAARLVEAGANAAEIYAAVYQQDSAPRVRLIGRMLERLELHAGGKLALLTLRGADFAATGADPNQTEDFVNEAGRLGTTEATVLLQEQPDGQIRINLRSKRYLNVAEIAARFGGGGHARAAGARLSGDFEAVVRQVVAAVSAALEKGPS
jgi:phosphoesterase RecJ-like protein